ncbi:MAG: hypothetical protein FJY36_03325 [Betaproteobacteria bacterium]|nr:hypothetical protein [Betaproteobacteria bacterium]
MNTSVNGALDARVQPSSSRALARLLLAVGVAMLVVGADQLMEPWAESHVLAAWIVLWAIAVAAIVVLRGAARALARQAMQGLDAWSARVARRRADRRLWVMAQTDARLMDGLQAALVGDDEGPLKDVQALAQRRVQRVMHQRLHGI